MKFMNADFMQLQSMSMSMSSFKNGWQTIIMCQFIVNFVLAWFFREGMIITPINLSNSLGMTMMKIILQIVTDIMRRCGGDDFYEQH